MNMDAAGVERRGQAGHGAERHGVAGLAWLGPARDGVAGHGMAGRARS